MKTQSEEKISEVKEKHFLESVRIASAVAGLKRTPKVKLWDSKCPHSTGYEIAHAHPDIGMICITRDRLNSMNLDEIEETATHEVSHMKHIGHDIDFQTTHSDAKLASWLLTHNVKTVGRKISLKDSKNYKKVCNFHLCKRKGKLFECKYCGNLYCRQHIKPKMVALLRDISDPVLEAEYRREDAHPDQIYTDIQKENIKNQEAEEMRKLSDGLDRLKNIPPEHYDSGYDYRAGVPIPKDRYKREPFSSRLRRRGMRFQRQIERFGLSKKSVLALGLIVIVFLAIYSKGSFESLTNYVTPFINNINSFIKNPGILLKQSPESTCASQVNYYLNILETKLPVRAIIVNTKVFTPKPGDISISNWIVSWSAFPTLIGGVSSIDCSQNPLPNFPEAYICKDLDTINSKQVYTGNEIMGVGIATKIEDTSGRALPEVIPALCDSNGNLMPNSKAFLQK